MRKRRLARGASPAAKWARIQRKPTMAAKRFRLTPQLRSQIVAAIRSGGYPHVAAEAFGVAKEIFDDWFKRGHENGAREPYLTFGREVSEAIAQARLRAEMSVFKDDPKVWLEHGPGRETPTLPGSHAGYVLRILGPMEMAGKYEWYELTLAAGGELASQAHDPGTSEHLTVLHGAVEVEVGSSKKKVKMDAILLAPTPITVANIDVAIKAGHITKDQACAGAKDVAACK